MEASFMGLEIFALSSTEWFYMGDITRTVGYPDV